MQNLIRRLLSIDPRKLTPAQIALILIGVIVVLAVLNFLLSLATTLIPLVVIGAAVYFGYRWLSSRSEALPEQKSRGEQIVEEAEANRQAARQKTATATEQVSVPMQATALADDEPQQRNLRVEQVVNPETGFAEPNIERLIAEEERKLQEVDQVNDDVLAQIEARRKRLLGKADDE